MPRMITTMVTKMKMYQLIDGITYDPRVNLGWGEGQWCIQKCLGILIRRTIEIVSEEYENGGT